MFLLAIALWLLTPPIHNTSNSNSNPPLPNGCSISDPCGPPPPPSPGP